MKMEVQVKAKIINSVKVCLILTYITSFAASRMLV